VKTILFVDDDPIIVQVYRSALVKSGYQVEVSPDGLDALRVILQLRPDLVLLDVLMPRVDGTYVLKFIRSRPELENTKVILLSDATIADAGQDAVAQKPDRVFLKSKSTPRDLVMAVAELFGDPPPAPATE
jgi:CheY-like chemotaxis protein